MTKILINFVPIYLSCQSFIFHTDESQYVSDVVQQQNLVGRDRSGLVNFDDVRRQILGAEPFQQHATSFTAAATLGYSSEIDFGCQTDRTTTSGSIGACTAQTSMA